MVERLTREEIRAVVGPADDATIAAILELGVTRSELAEAWAWTENDEAMLNEGRGSPGGRVAKVVEILQERDAEEEMLAARSA